MVQPTGQLKAAHFPARVQPTTPPYKGAWAAAHLQHHGLSTGYGGAGFVSLAPVDARCGAARWDRS